MATSPTYPYEEIQFAEAFELIENAEDSSFQEVKEDKGTWKERTVLQIYSSESVNLKCSINFYYSIHESTEIEPWDARASAGSDETVENITPVE